MPAIVGGLVLAAASPAVAQITCDPATASFRGEVPTAQEVLAIDLRARDVTTRLVAATAPTANAGGPNCVGPPPVANQDPGPPPEVTDHALVAGVGSVLPAASVALTRNTCLPSARPE